MKQYVAGVRSSPTCVHGRSCGTDNLRYETPQTTESVNRCFLCAFAASMRMRWWGIALVLVDQEVRIQAFRFEVMSQTRGLM